MNSLRGKIDLLFRSDYLKLIPILGLAFYITFIPHLDYPYAVHVDEWVHISQANSLLIAGNADYPDPFTGFVTTGRITRQLEIGFHVPMAFFYELSGLSWMDIARYLPSFIFCCTVLATYAFTKRLGFGWEAAFFAAMLPTTVGLLGPAFLVPMALALLVTMLIILLTYHYRSSWTYVVLFLLGAYLMILNGTYAIVAFLMIAPFLAFTFRDEKRHVLMIIGVAVFGFLLSLPWTYRIILDQMASFLGSPNELVYHQIPNLVTTFGMPAIAASLIYIFTTGIRGNHKSYGLVSGGMSLLIILALYNTKRYGFMMLYVRGLIFAMLVMSIFAGGGLKWIRTFDLAKLTRPSIRTRNKIIPAVAGLVLIIVTLIVILPIRQSTQYYHMIDQTDYENFLWIRDNVNPNLQRALLNPWEATAFTAITGRTVYTRIHDVPTSKDTDALMRITEDNLDVRFLSSTGIGIIYTRLASGNSATVYQLDDPFLTEVRPGIYIVNKLN